MYALIPVERQRAAMDWLDRQVFKTPDWISNNEVLRRIEGVGAMDRLRRYQVSAINTLLDPQRMARMMEAEAISGEEVYATADMLSDLRKSIWTELSSSATIGPFRRNLQRGHLERLEWLMNEEPPAVPSSFSALGYTNIDVSQSDIRAYVRGELQTLQREARRAATRTGDHMTRLIWRTFRPESRRSLTRTTEGRPIEPGPASGVAAGLLRGGGKNKCRCPQASRKPSVRPR